MLGWLFLAGAIVSEVGGTLSLRKTVDGSRLWYLPVVVGYVTAFTLLSLTLAQGCHSASPTASGRRSASPSPLCSAITCSRSRSRG